MGGKNSSSGYSDRLWKSKPKSLLVLFSFVGGQGRIYSIAVSESDVARLHELLLALLGFTGDFVLDSSSFADRRRPAAPEAPAVGGVDVGPAFRLAPELTFLQPSESAAATTAMLSAAASAIPRIRWAAPPRHSSSRTQWLLQRRRTLSSSSSNVTPAAAAGSGAGALEPPDLPRLAEAARISLSPQEAEEFAPKIRQMVDWFGQLQAVDLKSIEPSLGAGTVAGSSLREDKPEAFANRDAIVEAVPSYDDPYIKVPRVLNKE